MKAIFFIIISCGVFIACKHDKTTSDTTQQSAVTNSYKMLPPEQQNVIDVVNHWNTLHDSTQIDSLTDLYNDQVMFFKKRVSRKTVIDTPKIQNQTCKNISPTHHWSRWNLSIRHW